MFDKLISIIQSAGNALLPVQIVTEDKAGILMRMGKYCRTVHPGLCWKLPFLDSLLLCERRVQFYQTDGHSLVTADAVPVVVRALMSFRLADPKLGLLSQAEFGRSVWDGTAAAIAELVTQSRFEDLPTPEFSARLLDRVRTGNADYGTDILTCRLQDIARARTYRVLR